MADKQKHQGRPSGRPSASVDPTLDWPEPRGASIVCGRKVCTGCGWRHIMDFPMQTKGTLKSKCYRCSSEVERRRRGLSETPRKVYPTERARIEARRAAARAARRRRRQDPEYVREEREKRRIYEEGLRRKRGVKPRGVTYRRKDGTHYKESARDFVDAKPFVDWITSLPMPINEIANKAGIDSKRLYVFTNEDHPQFSTRVTIGFVDRVMHAIDPGKNINDLYP